MLSATTDNVISLLASLGFGEDFAGASHEIVIDNFDQWSNPSAAAVYGTLCASGADITEPVEVAA